MKLTFQCCAFQAATLCLTLAAFTAAISSGQPRIERGRERLQQTFNAGNYKDAYEGYRKLALDPTDDPRLVGDDLRMATTCLQQLGRTDEIDEFRERVIETHQENWHLLAAAAENYLSVEHHGFMIAGKFQRGTHRGGGQHANATARDRVRSLQLLAQAMPKLTNEDDHAAVSNFYLLLGRALLDNRRGGEAWRLQDLSDLNQLPDYDENWYYGSSAGAPVGEDDRPVYHHVPKSFESGTSDGQRWRWSLAQAIETGPQWTNAARWTLAEFFREQFGEQTIGYYGRHFREPEGDDDKPEESGIYALHTLGEDESIARLATGIKRFKLPDEFNCIKIFQQIADDPKTGYGEQSLGALAEIFENRRQYDKAADYWKRSIREYGAGDDKQKRLDQILGNWGTFEPIAVEPAGQGATVEFRFRNGSKVHFEAYEVHVQKLLDDVKAYIKSNPRQLDWNKINIGDIGYRLVVGNETQYIGKKVAAWDLDLQPRPQHVDKRITVTTPLQKAGAYLLSGTMADGNTSRIIIWVADTAIVKKPLAGKTYYFVADARTGEPIAKANLEFFGYRQRDLGQNRYRVETTNFAEFTDKDGQVVTGPKDPHNDLQWLITAHAKDGRFAYLGFTYVWHGGSADAAYDQFKVFVITDRPVYRPKQPVKFKFWVRQAKYDLNDQPRFANQPFSVEIHNPKGETVFTKSCTSDAYGGFDGEFELTADAMLGQYQLFIPNQGGGSFRVEEYKKPEFEVAVDAPAEPVMLGEKISATIRAKYYFGSPVTHARVKYKVLRSSYTESWYPVGDWDWLYGPGYWWYSYDYVWYPGWRDWGCRRPIASWWPRSHEPPEVVAEQDVEIGEDGTVHVEIDTAVAKAIHGDQDHQYQITAEVVDQSRRTIVGTGKVSVARKPFKVFAWVDRGYYRVGDVIHGSFSARTLDSKPVQGKGRLDLLKISYNDKGQPVETSVQEWDVDTDDQGHASAQIKASAAGQYRLSYRVTDANEHTIEGGYVFTVMGQGFDSVDYRFNDIELVADRREFRPGDKLKLQINTNRTGSTVLLFVRPANGIYLPPKVVRLKGKTTVEEIEVAQKDMPNFFVEAVTISGGKLHSETKEIVVPPEKRVLNVAVAASSESYKPGQKATVQLKLTDFFGKPFVGSTVMAIYDKSVEYISGGSNVPEIKAFFWKWRRSHYPQTESSLYRYFANLLKPGEIGMQPIGVLGELVADEYFDREDSFRGAGQEFRLRAAGRPATRDTGMEMTKSAPGAMAAMDKNGEFAPVLAMEPEQPAQLVEPTVRKNFADTALWIGSLTTDAAGTAEVSLDMPENLTSWKCKIWAMGQGTRVGQGEAEVVTRKDLIVRMQAPRFFVQKDEVVLSANVHNYLKNKKSVQVILELDGDISAANRLKESGVSSAHQDDRVTRPQPDQSGRPATEQTTPLTRPSATLSPRRAREEGRARGALDENPLTGTVALAMKRRVARPESAKGVVLASAHVSADEPSEQPNAARKNHQGSAHETEPGSASAKPTLQLVGESIHTVEIDAGSEARVDWRVKVLEEGEAIVRMKALSDEESDAMEMRFPVHVHGMLKTESWAGAMRPDESTAQVTIRVPAERRPEESRLEIRYSPTLAGAMVDALPYLVDYPYGCTEQTLNRFLPTVITQKILLRLGLDLAAIREKRSNLNAQEIGDDAERVKQWKRFDRNPVFDEALVQDMVKEGLRRLTEMQLSDGGWGWFSGWGEHSYPHTTALVVHGLQIAQQNDVAIVPGVIERGVAWLKNYQDDQLRLLKNAPTQTKPYKEHADNLDALVFMVLVDADANNPEMLDFLYRDRTHLAVYSKAIFGLALEKQGEREKLAMILRNIEQYLVQDDENQTAYLKLPEDNYWWRWYGSEFEADSYYLKLLARTEPKGETASRLVKYLLNNRKHATYWNSTRDTAVAIEALADYLRASGEDKPDLVVEIWMDGNKEKEVQITADNLLTFDNSWVRLGDAVETGVHTVEFRKRGRGPLYFNAYLTNFTLEDPIAAAGLEVKVNRKYYKLVPVDKAIQVAGSRGQSAGQKVEKYERQELLNLATLKSGDLAEIELEIDSKNDYEYLVFEDMKAAGFEPVELRSGYGGNALGAYMELRDDRVTFFVRALARGKHSVSYRMRAEIPGQFSALPALASAMYAPELKGNSDELKLRIED